MPVFSKAIRDIVERFLAQRGEMVSARLARMMSEAPEQLTTKLGAEPGLVDLLLRQPEQAVGALSGPESAGFARLISETAPRFEERLSNLRGGALREMRGAAPRPEIAAPSIDELLQRPQGQELADIQDRMTELLGRLSRVRSSRSAIPGQVEEELGHLRPLLRPAGPLDEETAEQLSFLRGERPPEPPPGFPIKRSASKRGRPAATFKRFKRMAGEVFPEGEIPVPLQELLDKLEMQPGHLRSGTQKVRRARSSEGLAAVIRKRMNPEQEMRAIGKVHRSAFLSKMSQRAQLIEDAQKMVPAYQALGDTRPEQEIIADLLRGGPESIGEITSRAAMLGQAPGQVSAFEQQFLRPIRERRAELKTPRGEPLSPEQVFATLHSVERGRLLERPGRAEFVGRVLKKLRARMQQRGAS